MWRLFYHFGLKVPYEPQKEYPKGQFCARKILEGPVEPFLLCSGGGAPGAQPPWAKEIRKSAARIFRPQNIPKHPLGHPPAPRGAGIKEKEPTGVRNWISSVLMCLGGGKRVYQVPEVSGSNSDVFKEAKVS